MNRLSKLLLAAVLSCMSLLTLGCASGGVYVGVGVAGPYGGYPYGGYPGYGGRPGYWGRYEEDALIDPVENGERLAHRFIDPKRRKTPPRGWRTPPVAGRLPASLTHRRSR